MLLAWNSIDFVLNASLWLIWKVSLSQSQGMGARMPPGRCENQLGADKWSATCFQVHYSGQQKSSRNSIFRRYATARIAAEDHQAMGPSKSLHYCISRRRTPAALEQTESAAVLAQAPHWR